MFEPPETKRDMLRVRMTTAERDTLKALAAGHGMTEAALIRWLIKRELDAQAQQATTPKRKRATNA